MWPTSKVVGVDCSEVAIIAARELAARLKLENVTFERIDGPQFLTPLLTKFSLITAILSMHEILQRPTTRKPFHWEEPYCSLEEIRLTGVDEPAIALLKQVGSALTPGGLFISLDRSPTPATTWWYAQCLQEAGLSVSFRRSYKVDAKTAFGTEKFPIMVTERTCEGQKKINPDEILSLVSFRELSELAIVFEGDVAKIRKPSTAIRNQARGGISATGWRRWRVRVGRGRGEARKVLGTEEVFGASWSAYKSAMRSPSRLSASPACRPLNWRHGAPARGKRRLVNCRVSLIFCVTHARGGIRKGQILRQQWRPYATATADRDLSCPPSFSRTTGM